MNETVKPSTCNQAILNRKDNHMLKNETKNLATLIEKAYTIAKKNHLNLKDESYYFHADMDTLKVKLMADEEIKLDKAYVTAYKPDCDRITLGFETKDQADRAVAAKSEQYIAAHNEYWFLDFFDEQCMIDYFSGEYAEGRHPIPEEFAKHIPEDSIYV